MDLTPTSRLDNLLNMIKTGIDKNTTCFVDKKVSLRSICDLFDILHFDYHIAPDTKLLHYSPSEEILLTVQSIPSSSSSSGVIIRNEDLPALRQFALHTQLSIVANVFVICTTRTSVHGFAKFCSSCIYRADQTRTRHDGSYREHRLIGKCNPSFVIHETTRPLRVFVIWAFKDDFPTELLHCLHIVQEHYADIPSILLLNFLSLDVPIFFNPSVVLQQCRSVLPDIAPMFIRQRANTYFDFTPIPTSMEEEHWIEINSDSDIHFRLGQWSADPDIYLSPKNNPPYGNAKLPGECTVTSCISNLVAYAKTDRNIIGRWLLRDFFERENDISIPYIIDLLDFWLGIDGLTSVVDHHPDLQTCFQVIVFIFPFHLLLLLIFFPFFLIQKTCLFYKDIIDDKFPRDRTIMCIPKKQSIFSRDQQEQVRITFQSFSAARHSSVAPSVPRAPSTPRAPSAPRASSILRAPPAPALPYPRKRIQQTLPGDGPHVKHPKDTFWYDPFIPPTFFLKETVDVSTNTDPLPAEEPALPVEKPPKQRRKRAPKKNSSCERQEPLPIDFPPGMVSSFRLDTRNQPYYLSAPVLPNQPGSSFGPLPFSLLPSSQWPIENETLANIIGTDSGNNSDNELKVLLEQQRMQISQASQRLQLLSEGTDAEKEEEDVTAGYLRHLYAE